MKKHLLLLVFTAAMITTSAQQNFQYYYGQAREAAKAGDAAKLYEMSVKANELHPYHQGALYYRGIGSAMTNKPEEAIRCLRDAILINASFSLTTNELSSLSGNKEFEALKEFQKEITTPVTHSDTAFTLKDRSLHLETVAQGEKSGVYYFSSIHKRKVLRMDEKGKVIDFTSRAQDGTTAVLGLKVNKEKNLLWVCSSPMEVMENYDTALRSSVCLYNLKTKKLLAQYTPDPSIKNSIFGDLILNKKGEVFISDSPNNIIFKVNESSGQLESFYTSEELWNIQGITFSEDEQYLFIADYIKGIFRLTLATKELIQVSREPLISLKGIDGLMWYKGSLIAIQNGVSPMRVTRYYLNSAFDKITRFEIIDRAHPAFNEPTNGCIIDDKLFYVGNSQWSGYDNNNKLKPVDQLQDIVILKTDLKKIK